MLQCVAVCCSVLQCLAVSCSVLHCNAVCARVCYSLVAVCCSALQCVAVRRSASQCVAVRRSVQHDSSVYPSPPQICWQRGIDPTIHKVSSKTDMLATRNRPYNSQDIFRKKVLFLKSSLTKRTLFERALLQKRP